MLHIARISDAKADGAGGLQLTCVDEHGQHASVYVSQSAAQQIGSAFRALDVKGTAKKPRRLNVTQIGYAMSSAGEKGLFVDTLELGKMVLLGAPAREVASDLEKKSPGVPERIH